MMGGFQESLVVPGDLFLEAVGYLCRLIMAVHWLCVVGSL